MDDDRKYKQRGYQEDGRKQPPSSPAASGAGKGPSFTAYREAVQCDSCGAQLGAHFDAGFTSRCPKCGSDLHTCRNCLNLDPGARFECSQPVAERVEDKSAGNRCPEYTPRRVQVKETSFSTSPRPEDARRALENLFRKK